MARLARLSLADDEARALAAQMSAIADAFSDLAAFAATLPPPPTEQAAPLRKDDTHPPTREEADALLAAAPRVDAPTRAVRAPRGLSQ